MVARYDRAPRGGRLVRVHQEDLCQASGLHPDHKCQRDGGPSPADAAALLRRVVGLSGAGSAVDQLRDMLIVQWLVVHNDAHSKSERGLIGGQSRRRVVISALVRFAHGPLGPRPRPVWAGSPACPRGLQELLGPACRWQPGPRSAVRRLYLAAASATDSDFRAARRHEDRKRLPHRRRRSCRGPHPVRGRVGPRRVGHRPTIRGTRCRASRRAAPDGGVAWRHRPGPAHFGRLRHRTDRAGAALREDRGNRRQAGRSAESNGPRTSAGGEEPGVIGGGWRGGGDERSAAVTRAAPARRGRSACRPSGGNGAAGGTMSAMITPEMQATGFAGRRGCRDQAQRRR